MGINWSGGAQGAAGGAMAGSAVGGPAGTLIGGGLGLLGGLFGGDGTDKRMLDYYNQLTQQGPAAQAGYSDFRGNQANLISNLEAQASGRGPSLAGEQLKAAQESNSKQQLGLAQSGAGNPAAAAMMAQSNIAQMGMQSSQDAAQARMQEIYNAQNLLGLNIQSGRGADEGVNTFNAQQTNMGDAERNRMRLYALQGSKSGPSMGEQILAGGGGMYGQAQQMAMLNRGGQPQGQYGGNMNGMLGRAQPGQFANY